MASALDLLIAIKARDEASAILGGVGGAIGKLGLAAAAAGAGIAAGMAVGIKAAGDLQQSVANISTIKPEVDTSAVFAQLNQISTRVPQSAKEIGDGLYNIFSSLDVSTEQGLSLVETFAKGAVGASTDAATFGTAAMGVMNAYGLSAEDAGHISDVFFNTINKGVVTGSELAANLGLVTQSAKMAGVDLESLGGFIVGVTKEGGNAAQNINNLNNLLLKITTKEAAAGFHALGIATADATGAFRPQVDVLSDLKVKLAGMSDEAKTLAMQKIFPDLQARAGAAVIMGELDKVKEAIEINKDSAGSAEAAYIKMSATFNSQSKLLGNAFTAMLTTFGASVLPIITPMITAFAKMLPDAMITAGDTMDSVKARIGGGLQTIAGALAATGASWAPWAAQAGPAGDAVSASLSGVSGVVEALQLALQGNFAGAFVTAQAAMGSFSTAIDSLGAAFLELIPQVDRDEIWSNLKDAVKSVGDAFALLWPEIQKTGGETGTTAESAGNLSASLKDLSAGVKDVAASLSPIIETAIQVGTALDAVSDASTKAGISLHNTTVDRVISDFQQLEAVSHTLGQSQIDLHNTIVDAWSTMTAAIQEAMSSMIAAVGSAMSAIGTTVGDGFSALGTAVQSNLAAIQGFFGDTWSQIPEDIRADLAIVSGLIVQDLGEWLGSMVSGMADIGTAILSGWTAVVAAVSTAMSDIGTAVQNGWAAITGVTSGAMTENTTTVSSGWDGVLAATSAAWTAITAAISGALATGLAAVSGWVGSVIAAVSGLADAMGAAGRAAGQAAVAGLTGALTSGIRAVGDAAADLARSALNSAKAALGAHSPSLEMAELGGDAAEGLVIGLKSKNQAVREAAKELARQAQIAVQVAAPVDSFLVVGQDMGDGIALGLLRGVDKAKSAAGTYGESILGELQSFTQKVNSEIQASTNKLADIGTAANKAIQSALDKESDSIDASITKMQTSLASLYATRGQDLDTSSRKGALSAALAQETLAHNAVAAAEEMAYQHSLTLAQAKLKFDSDMATATTAVKRTELETQYADQVASANKSYADAQTAAAHRQDLDAAERAFRASQEAKTKALDDALAGEAMARQVSSIIAAQAVAAAAAEQSSIDAQTAAQLTADAQRLILLRSYDQRIEDLKTAFLDKIPELEGPALEAFTAFMDNINAQTVAMGATVAGSMSTAATAIQDTFGTAIPDALGVTDAAVEAFADTWGVSWDAARETLEAGASAVVEGAGKHIPTALQTAADTAKKTLGAGGVIPTAARVSAEALNSVGSAAGSSLTTPLNMLKDAAAKLGSGGLAVAAQAAKNLEAQFPGLTAAVNDWIATLGGIPTTVTTDIITNYLTKGTPVGAGGVGGAGGVAAGGTGAKAGAEPEHVSPFPGHIGESGPGGKYNDPSTGHPYTRAGGGPVSAGTLYEINENRRGSHGVELFMPAMNGSISPQGGGGGWSGGGGVNEDRLADKIAAALMRAMQASPPRVDLEEVRSGLVRIGQRNGGQVGLG